MRKTILTVALLVICPLLFAQQALNNDSVIKLVKAGLSDDLIVTTVNAQAGTYDTSTDGLIALKAAGVSDNVVSAIVQKAAATPPTVTQLSSMPATADPDDPAAPHDAGIYVYDEKAANHKMTMLEPTLYDQSKVEGLLAAVFSYGIAASKIKDVSVIRNAHANVRVSDPSASFYFYFERLDAGLSDVSGLFGGTSTPNEYSLLRLDVKKDSRETVTSSGFSGGTDEKANVAFTYIRLQPGIYKVTPNAPLPTGEYAFVLPAGVIGSSHVFDFGVN
jgi:hypothetical protein